MRLDRIALILITDVTLIRTALKLLSTVEQLTWPWLARASTESAIDWGLRDRHLARTGRFFQVFLFSPQMLVLRVIGETVTKVVHYIPVQGYETAVAQLHRVRRVLLHQIRPRCRAHWL